MQLLKLTLIKAVIHLLLFLLFVPISLAAQSPVVAYLWQGASMIHLLTPSLADSNHLEKLAPKLEVVDGQHVLLLTLDGNLFDLEQREYLPAKKPLHVTSFAYSNGLLVVIRDDRLGWYSDGEIKERFVLPLKGMKVVAGKGQRLYLYGPRGKGSVIYLLENNKVFPLTDIPEGKISAFTVIGERIFFAIDNTIYTVAKGEHAGLVFIVAGEKRVHSLAVDTIAGMLYFSTGEAVYIMRAGVALTILKGLKGILRYSRNALFVLDPGRRRLVKINGLERLIMGEGRSTKSITPDLFKE